MDITKYFGGKPFDPTLYEKPGPRVPALDLFLDELNSNGLHVEAINPSGVIQRCPTEEGKANNKNGWYVFFEGAEISSGAYGNWQTGEARTWCSHLDNDMTEAQRVEYRQHVVKQKELARIETERTQSETAASVNSLISNLPYTAKHSYLDRKKVGAYGIYSDGEAIVVPMRNIEGEVRSVQHIHGNGFKQFHKGGQVSGCFHLIGSSYTEPTYIAEGYATAATIHEATGRAVLVVFTAGNIQSVVTAFREAGNMNQVIICADNDRHLEKNAGIIGAEKACKDQFGVSYIFPEFKGSEGTDFNDLMEEQGQDVVKKQILGKRKPKNSFEITLIKDLPEPEPIPWSIKDYLVEDTLSCIFGPSGSGKSFLALDMGLHIAAGKEWHGHEVTKGGVVYIAGEGRSGVIGRINAWCKHHDIPKDIPFSVSKGPVMFLDVESVNYLMECIRELAEKSDAPSLIIVDTLNRNFGDGDENSTQDMTNFINALTHVQREIQTAICVVHHSGLKDSQRARGSSAFRAALDTELSVNKLGESGLILRTTKQKDAAESEEKSFDYQIVELGKVGDEEISSQVLTDVQYSGLLESVSELGAKTNRTRQVEEALLAVIKELSLANGGQKVTTIKRSELVKKLVEFELSKTIAYEEVENMIERGLLTETSKYWLEINDL